jgi:LuxR family maltose regulon positive regulatory protein
MNPLMPLEKQLLVTKLSIPLTSRTFISRPRLTDLLNQSPKYSLTLISAAAGFGKTTLLASWRQSLPNNNLQVAWVSLDKEDNEPRLFWAYVLAALNKQVPERFSSLLALAQSPQSFPLNYLLVELINLLKEGTDHFLLILDDYHFITEQQIHTALTYLIEHLPPQLRIIVATRSDPPLSLARLRARKQALEVRTNQLRCTPEETKAFLQQVMDLSLPDETIQEVTMRTEGWLVGMQLLGLSLPGRTTPEELLQEISGDQRYILGYLTQEVLRRQPQEVQTFLLCTSILEEGLTASLCNAVVEQTESQLMLQQIEQANLFVVSLDSRRQWYRYHALFAEALYRQLKQRHADLIPLLHHRASLWYAKHNQIIQAILHALRAKEWQWAADLIEHTPSLFPLTWEASQRQQVLLGQWLEQLPPKVIGSRPRFCLACTQLLWAVAPYPLLEAWLEAAQVTLTASLAMQMGEQASDLILKPQARQEQENLLGEVIASHALLLCHGKNGDAALQLCQQALVLLSVENPIARTQVAQAQILSYYNSAANNAMASIKIGLQSASLAQAAGQIGIALGFLSTTIVHMIGTGQLHEAHRLTQQATLLGSKPGGTMSPEVGWSTVFQAEVLREWNRLDEACALIEEAISLCKQAESLPSLVFLLYGYGIQLRVCLSQGKLDAARSAFQHMKCMNLNQSVFTHHSSHFTAVDQVKLWLACEEPDQARSWAEQLDVEERHSAPLVHERQDTACARILLAQAQPNLSLQRLEAVLQRATEGQRWGHVIEVRILQALAYHMCQEEAQALDALSEAVRLAEPEGYIRSFVDEGAPMEALLYRLRKRDRKSGLTPYLDTLLTAFQQENKAHVRADKPTEAYQLPEPLSKRELEILQLLARGVSNQEIAQELMIALDTVKRHASTIFSKLGVRNRIQAVKQAREIDLLDEEP